MSIQKQWVFAPKPFVSLKFFFYQTMNMRKLQLNPNFYGKNKIIIKLWQIFKFSKRKSWKFGNTKKTKSLNTQCSLEGPTYLNKYATGKCRFADACMIF